MQDIYRFIAQSTIEGRIDKQFAAQMINLIKTKGIEKTKDIAIIGIAAQFPMACNVQEFWFNLKNGIDCITDFPSERKKDVLYKENKTQPGIGGYLTNIDKFDNNFFNLSNKEAELMDPNQRLFLQIAWSAIEDAGYGGTRISGTKTGVYVGYSNDFFGNDYRNIIIEGDPESFNLSIPGNIKSIITSRISHILDLKGPSMIVDTACSSSLVALHLACQGLKANECDMAIAGGIRITFNPFRKSSGIEIDSSDGKTKSFDDSSNGTGWGEGVATVLLKPLNNAIKDRDNIYAVIKGSAINQDGNSIGITAPNALAQRDVILQAWKEANIDPETISYIEAHGTGTKLGDPIEIEGLEKAFRIYTNKNQFCAIGSVKSNIGHLDSASGMAGLIKAVLALKYKLIPPTLHFVTPNRNIEFAQSPLYVNDRLTEWNTNGFPRRCGVSAFGISGTNGHVILEEAPSVNSNETYNGDSYNIFTISAKSIEALSRFINIYYEFLKNNTDINVLDMCYTVNTGRGQYGYRIALIIKDEKDLIGKLEELRYSEFKNINTLGIYYGEHKVISNKRENINKGEITQEQKELKNEKSKRIINQLIEDSQNNVCYYFDQICKLFIEGADIDWDGIYKNSERRRVSLPSYPFDPKRHWIEYPEVQSINYNTSYNYNDITEEDITKIEDQEVIREECNQNYTQSEIESKLKMILCEVLNYEEDINTIDIEDSLDIIGLNSLIFIKVAVTIESEFNIRFESSDLDISSYENLKDIISVIEKKLNNLGALTFADGKV